MGELPVNVFSQLRIAYRIARLAAYPPVGVIEATFRRGQWVATWCPTDNPPDGPIPIASTGYTRIHEAVAATAILCLEKLIMPHGIRWSLNTGKEPELPFRRWMSIYANWTEQMEKEAADANR